MWGSVYIIIRRLPFLRKHSPTRMQLSAGAHKTTEPGLRRNDKREVFSTQGVVPAKAETQCQQPPE